MSTAIVVPGTGWRRWRETYAPGSRLMQWVARIFGTTPVLFPWSGRNTKAGRRAAARRLAGLIARSKFQPGESLNLVGFSHGGNVAALATRSLAGQPVDNLVTIGTPVLAGYQPAGVQNHIHVYNPADTIQAWGGEAIYLPGHGTVGPAGRTFAGATNLAVVITGDKAVGRHGNLIWHDSTWTGIQEHVGPRG